jgi:cytochrome b pre-mRNA-processing protein 3
MDVNLREMGVSDMSVGKRNRAMWEAFHGRSAAYAAAWTDGEKLAETVARNVWRGQEALAGSPDALVRLARAQARHLEDQPLEALLRGAISFTPAEEAAQ